MKLVPMTEADLEMVRTWRNSPHVNENMFFQNHITKEQQQAWFSTRPKDDEYWIICTDKPIGMCNLKNVIMGHQAEIGIFIGEKEYLNSNIAFKAMLEVHDYAFMDLGLRHTIARIKPGNKRAIRFNKAFGYEVVESLTPEVFLTLSAQTYLQKRPLFSNI